MALSDQGLAVPSGSCRADKVPSLGGNEAWAYFSQGKRLGSSGKRFPGPTTCFAASMPSCGCCECDKFDNNNSNARGVGVLCQKQDGCQVGGVEIWG